MLRYRFDLCPATTVLIGLVMPLKWWLRNDVEALNNQWIGGILVIRDYLCKLNTGKDYRG